MGRQKMIINSILDNDAYKLSMDDAIIRLYPDAEAEFQFINRRPSDVFDSRFKKLLDYEIRKMSALSLTDEEYKFLKTKMPYLSKSFLEYIRNYRFNPKEVETAVDEAGKLSVRIRGPWFRSSLWEVPLMAIISEIYFGGGGHDWNGNFLTWDYDYLIDDTERKAKILSGAGCNWADFGTRRRRSWKAQDMVVACSRGFNGFVGTSNVFLAMKYNTKPIGTVAHEWTQAHSVLTGMRHANRFAMDAWVKAFRGDLGIALTDTYGTEAFFDDFDLYFAKLYSGTRQDSGDPFCFANNMVAHYCRLGIDPASKTIVFSDALDAEKCVLIKQHCDRLGIKCSFGIGTEMSNSKTSFPGPLRALNMVIKMVRLNGIPVVKLSDDPSKAVGDPDAIRVAKWTFFGTPLDAGSPSMGHSCNGVQR